MPLKTVRAMDASLLAKVDLFKTLSPESLAEIAAVTKQLNVGASQRVVKIGDVAREMFFVLSGTFFGELGLIYNIPRTVNVIAKSALQLCVLQKADFDTLRDRHPDIASAIEELAQERFSHFQSLVWPQLAPHQLQVERPSDFSDEQQAIFKQIFYAYSEGKGHINVEQLAKLLNRVINTDYELSMDEANLFMRKLDKDNDGAIDFKEFVAGLKYISWIAGEPGPQKKKYNPYMLGAAVAGLVLVGGFAAFALFRRQRK